MIQKGGMTYWVPVAVRELTAVSSYLRWEQAFRVYMNVYAKANPARITELLQYNHVIETAATAYPWENVYKYDREFHIHMGEHPECNWGLILQAWALYIKSGQSSNIIMSGGVQGSSKPATQNGWCKICFPFNR